jgi:ATP-binding cassette, subfamily C, bacterial LapB
MPNDDKKEVLVDDKSMTSSDKAHEKKSSATDEDLPEKKSTMTPHQTDSIVSYELNQGELKPKTKQVPQSDTASFDKSSQRSLTEPNTTKEVAKSSHIHSPEKMSDNITAKKQTEKNIDDSLKQSTEKKSTDVSEAARGNAFSKDIKKTSEQPAATPDESTNTLKDSPESQLEADNKPIAEKVLPFHTRLSDRFFDPLLESLVIITQLKQRPYSADTLKAGLPLQDNYFTPDIFIRAAERAGLAGRLVKRSLKQIKNVLLPAVLLLENGDAAVLVKIENGNCHVIYPESGLGETVVPLETLSEKFTGYVLFVQVIHNFEKRAEEEHYIPRSKNWFWGTLWKFKYYYFQVIVASLFVNIFALASPLFVMNVYDRVVPNNAVSTLWVLAIGAAMVFIFDFILRTLRAIFIDLAGKKVDTILSSTLFEQVLGIKMLEQGASTGVQANHLKDFENVRDFFTSATITSIVDLPFIFVFLFFIYVLAGPLVWIPLIAIPIVAIVAILLSIPLNRAVSKAFVGGAQKSAILVEALNNLEVIKSSSSEGSILSRWEKYVGITAKSGIESRFYSTLAVNFCMIMTYLVTVLIVIFGVYQLEEKELTLGGLIACNILAGRALAPLSQVTTLLTRYQLTKLSLSGLNMIMAKPLDRPAEKKFLHRPSFNGDIVFEDVVFRYPGASLDLFKEINFKIHAKEKVAILGGMGSGKTSLLKLMMGFYQPSSGAIYIDGTDMSQIDPADLRRAVGFVAQDPKLFFGTARDNIAMKAPWADDIEVLNCARISGADKFISKHPAGYDMPIGENGKGLSGGQAQTITIARALLTSPSILLLDEPTSCMDNSTEQLLMHNLQQYLVDKTLVLVTHKVSLLQLVDRLIVLQAGRIVADGPKDKVLEALRHMSKSAVD